MGKTATIVTINSGSSSLKFKLFSSEGPLTELLGGKMIGIGSSAGTFEISFPNAMKLLFQDNEIGTIEKATRFLITWLKQQENNYIIKAIGHRVVHGGLRYSEPVYINEHFITHLKEITPLAPLHLPDSIIIMTLFLQAFPVTPQIACFDTFFHRQMPFEAKHFALPRFLWNEGIIRYGFHGLSCQYIIEYLKKEKTRLANKKMIIAHLGNGCSLTAIKEGWSIDTTMGLTPTGGLIMNNRPGDLDPGVILYLLEEKNLSVPELNILLNKNAGLKAIAETDISVPELLQKEVTDIKARQALAIFCYQIKKQIGAFAAALGGLDILVFTGGIGEHEPVIRERICNGLGFLGIHIDKDLNNQKAVQINTKNSNVAIQVIPAGEEFIIASEILKLWTHYPIQD